MIFMREYMNLKRISFGLHIDNEYCKFFRQMFGSSLTKTKNRRKSETQINDEIQTINKQNMGIIG